MNAEKEHLRYELKRLNVVVDDMLAALEAVFADLQAVDNYSELTLHVGRQVRAAILKAKGESS